MPQDTTSFGELLSRLFWMMLGPFALLILAASIINTGNGWLTPVDIAFLAVLGGIMLARWLEFRGGNPRRADGEPATHADLRRFLIGVLAIGLAVWVAANLIANHWLASE